MAYELRVELEGIAAMGGAASFPALSFHWAVSRPDARRDPAAAPEVQDLSLVKRVDAASPPLLAACCRGQRFPSATLVVRETGGERRQRFAIRLRDVLVSSVRPGGAADAHEEFPLEEVSLAFGGFQAEYGVEGADGKSLGTASRGAFDRAE